MVFGHRFEAISEGGAEYLAEVLHGNAVLGAPWPCQTGFDGTEIELEQVIELWLLHIVRAEQSLCLCVALDQVNQLLAAPGAAQVEQGFRVDREERRSGAKFRRHVRNGGAVGQRQVAEARASKLDELGHDPALAQHLRHSQHEIGGRRTIRQRACQPHADDLWCEEIERLSEQYSFRFYTAGTPAEDAQAVDHGGMRIGANQCIGKSNDVAVLLLCHYHRGEVLKVHLVDDAGARRHDTKIAERLLPPAQQGITLTVAFVLSLDVASKSERRAEHIYLHRVIDYEVSRHQGIHLFRVTPHASDSGAHGCEIGYRWHACKILQQHASRQERIFRLGLRRLPWNPACQRQDIHFAHKLATSMAQNIF